VVFATVTDSLTEDRSDGATSATDIRGLFTPLDALVVALLVFDAVALVVGAEEEVVGDPAATEDAAVGAALGTEPALLSCPLVDASLRFPSELEEVGALDGAISMLAIKDGRICVLSRII
jgi:hypothetical protein